MAKRKHYKIGEVVEFSFAGSTEKGVITHVDEAERYTVDDGKFTYPVYAENIVNVIK